MSVRRLQISCSFALHVSVPLKTLQFCLAGTADTEHRHNGMDLGMSLRGKFAVSKVPPVLPMTGTGGALPHACVQCCLERVYLPAVIIS